MKIKLYSIVTLLCAALLAMVATGCNTTRGLGRDVERTGEKIQDGTR